MIDYFALLDEARRPWLDPERLKEKYFARNRAAPADAELNEAFRVLSDPKLRLQHLLTLEGAQLTAGRPVPPSVAELFWNTGTVLREVDRLLLKKRGSEQRSLPRPLERRTGEAGRETGRTRAATERHLRNRARLGCASLAPVSPNELEKLIQLYDSISYLTRLREQVKEKRHRLNVA